MKNNINLLDILNRDEIEIEFKGYLDGLELIIVVKLKLKEFINYFSKEFQDKYKRFRDLFLQINFK